MILLVSFIVSNKCADVLEVIVHGYVLSGFVFYNSARPCKAYYMVIQIR